MTKSIATIFAVAIIAIAAIGGLTACSHPQDSWVMTSAPNITYPQETATQVDQTTGLKTVEPPKVEFLFVEDNSDSMQVHIKAVDDNIGQFAEEFSRNNPTLFHFSVVPIYDSMTFQSAAYQKEFGSSAFTHCGQFEPVKDADDKVVPNKYFISSTDPDWETELKSTMEIGISNLAKGGPNYEETFSPVAAVWGGVQDQPLELTGQAGVQELAQIETNRQGYRFGSNDSYKIVFFITDANDDSTISASQLFNELKQASGGDASKVWGFAAIVPPGCKTNGRSCERDDAGPPYKIEEFLQLTNHLPFDPRTHQRESNAVSLFDPSFGRKFADWGRSIREQTITQKIPLQDVPVINNDPSQTLRVYYGNQEIPWENKPGIVGYTYDANSKSVILDPKLQLNIVPGAKLHVQYTAIPPQAVMSGRVKEYSTP